MTVDSRKRRQAVLRWLAGMTAALLCTFCGGCKSADPAVIPGEPVGLIRDSGALFEESAVTEKETPCVIYVHVCGAVNAPGVVTLPEGSRGQDALEAAGGFSPQAAVEAVNLAQPLEDGAQLYFPTREEEESLLAAQKERESGLVDLNTADRKRLCTLPGIGEAKAEAILAYRNENGDFQRVEDIMRVPGIKESAFEKIKDLITVK